MKLTYENHSCNLFLNPKNRFIVESLSITLRDFDLAIYEYLYFKNPPCCERFFINIRLNIYTLFNKLQFCMRAFFATIHCDTLGYVI